MFTGIYAHSIRAFLEGLILSLIITPFFRWIALRYKILDEPGERRVHESPVPLLGGAAIYLAFTMTALHRLPMDRSLLGLLYGGTFILAVGLIDDIFDLSPKLKFLGQIIAAVIVVSCGVEIEFVTNPFGGMFYLGRFAVPATILWIISITNVVNFIDGLDGLAAGVSSIAAIALFVVAVGKGQVAVATLAIILAGCAVGFLRYNFNPARIFMGDAGAMFLGFSLSTIAVIGALKGATTIALAIPTLVLGVPILDTAFAIVRRLENGIPFYVADKDHVHHRLLALGLSQRQAVLIIYLVTGFLGVSAVLAAQMGTGFAYLAFLLIAIMLFMAGKRAGVMDLRHVDRLPANRRPQVAGTRYQGRFRRGKGF